MYDPKAYPAQASIKTHPDETMSLRISRNSVTGYTARTETIELDRPVQMITLTYTEYAIDGGSDVSIHI